LAVVACAAPAVADEFFFMGATTTIPIYGANPKPGCYCEVGPNDGFSFNSHAALATPAPGRTGRLPTILLRGSLRGTLLALVTI